jgi:hypothetical protein
MNSGASINLNSSNLKGYIKEIIKKIHELYLQETGTFNLPISEILLCKTLEKFANIKIALEPYSRVSNTDEGLIIPIRGGFIIRYATIGKDLKKFSSHKIRETICHEMGHILFYDCTTSIPKLILRPEEYLCHYAAREFLMPEEITKKFFLKKRQLTPNLIEIVEQLASEFQIAIFHVIIRLTEDLSLAENTFFTYWKYLPHLTKKYNGYMPDSKFSKDLIISNYWREKIHVESWNKNLIYLAEGKTNYLSDVIIIKGKNRTLGKIKSFRISLQAGRLYSRLNELNINFSNEIIPNLTFLSSQTLQEI